MGKQQEKEAWCVNCVFFFVRVFKKCNFCDLASRRVISIEDMEQWMRKQPENVYLLESSLKDCFGLKELHTWLNRPFLTMKVFYFFFVFVFVCVLFSLVTLSVCLWVVGVSFSHSGNMTRSSIVTDRTWERDIYIYIYIERERERERFAGLKTGLCNVYIQATKPYWKSETNWRRH